MSVKVLSQQEKNVFNQPLIQTFIKNKEGDML